MPIFNSPPGWPTPPPGWTPPQGWQPDPSWPPAPTDHLWWIEDTPASSAASDSSDDAALGRHALAGMHVPALEPLEDERPARRRAPALALAGAPAREGAPARVAGVRASTLTPARPRRADVPTQPAAPAAERHDPVPPATVVPVPVPVPGIVSAGPVASPVPVPVPAPAADLPVVPFVPAAPGAPTLDLVRFATDDERRAGRRSVVLGVVLLLVALGGTVYGYAAPEVGDLGLVLGSPAVPGLLLAAVGKARTARAERTALRRVLAPVR